MPLLTDASGPDCGMGSALHGRPGAVRSIGGFVLLAGFDAVDDEAFRDPVSARWSSRP